MDARHEFSEYGGDPGFIPWVRPEAEKAQPVPASEKWNSRPETGKWIAGTATPVDGAEHQYRIQGWLARTGTSVWFGAGSTGKTQLMLWMAATLASRPEDRAETWLGGKVHGSGHVLILTAEDTREQITQRLRDVVEHAMQQGPEARARTCSRIHIMPFLSMREDEFDHPNPSLFHEVPVGDHKGATRQWCGSGVMMEVRRYIMEWNRTHPPDDRIIGVVMDSATSMAGFDSLDAQATTNFFFYLGRLCERLGIFWAIIGHTPKTTTLNYKTYRATAPSRLRGVAMWTTAPRLTVEVRLSQSWRIGKRSEQEAKDHLDWLPGRWSPNNLLIVYVAKANLKYACTGERILARQRNGAFVDITDRPEAALTNGSLTGWVDAVPARETRAPDVEDAASVGATRRKPRKPGRSKRNPADYFDGTAFVAELVAKTYPARDLAQSVSANRLGKLAIAAKAAEPKAKLVTSSSGGGRTEARVGSINWHLDRLVEIGTLSRGDRGWKLPPAPPTA